MWLSDNCDYKAGVSLRGGVPICWPWFGDLNRNPRALKAQYADDAIVLAPAHGFVRNQDWDVKKIERVGSALTVVELGLDFLENKEPLWPFATELRCTIEVGQHVSIDFNVRNHGNRPFIFSRALHSYFNVENIESVSINGFDGVEYIDTLDNWQAFTQQGNIVFNREVDRIYQSSPSPIVLKDDSKIITVSAQGSHSTVVWNPWIDKSMRLSQFDNLDYQKMVCVETGNIGDDIVELAPDHSSSLSVKIV